MTIQDIYQLAIKKGIAYDPRGEAGVIRALDRIKKEYKTLPKKEQDYFDQESLKNPYSDTRILFGDPTIVVDKVLVGIAIHVAENLMRNRIGEVYRRFAPLNHHQSIDAARLLNIPLMCMHTPTDNIGWKYLADRLEHTDLDTVADVMDELYKVPELKMALKDKAGPVIFAGTPRSRAGKVRVVEFT